MTEFKFVFKNNLAKFWIIILFLNTKKLTLIQKILKNMLKIQ